MAKSTAVGVMALVEQAIPAIYPRGSGLRRAFVILTDKRRYLSGAAGMRGSPIWSRRCG